MARHDVRNDVTPALLYKPQPGNQIATMRAQLTGYQATGYSSARLDDMTKNDMLYAARLHSLSSGNPI